MGGSESAQRGDFVQPKAMCPSHSEAKQVKTLGFGAGRGLHLFPSFERCRNFLWAASLKAQVCPHPGPSGRGSEEIQLAAHSPAALQRPE